MPVRRTPDTSSLHTPMPGPKAPEEARRGQILEAAYRVAVRSGIPGLTLRAVAGEAGLSHGLVLFHFKKKEQLVASLLDRVLSRSVLLLMQEPLPEPGRGDRLIGMLGRQLEAVVANPDDVRLFFGYWALGATVPAVRIALGAALAQHRAEYREAAACALAARNASATLTPSGMASVAMSLVHGCAVQALGDPESFDAVEYIAAAMSVMQRAMGPV